ncbi:hypothetical protein BJV82DRAFT_168756 [Fennellomyces sp. T-0311]|nr:hypothetical protein BJV82DRAFT_168756 [Fennellomyces sp. T-0311]
MSNFIGFVVHPNEPLTLAIEDSMHLTMASLLDNAKPGRSTLKIEQQSLDIHFKDADEPTLLLTGVNPISITGNVTQDDDEFIPEEDDEDEDDYGPIQFRDPSDERFLGGFELRHFGLEPHFSFYPDKIDLRKEEVDEEDTMLHDNIVMGLINSMLNSGDEVKVNKAKAILEQFNSRNGVESTEKGISKRGSSSQKRKKAKKSTSKRS